MAGMVIMAFALFWTEMEVCNSFADFDVIGHSAGAPVTACLAAKDALKHLQICHASFVY